MTRPYISDLFLLGSSGWSICQCGLDFRGGVFSRLVRLVLSVLLLVAVLGQKAFRFFELGLGLCDALGQLGDAFVQNVDGEAAVGSGRSALLGGLALVTWSLLGFGSLWCY